MISVSDISRLKTECWCRKIIAAIVVGLALFWSEAAAQAHDRIAFDHVLDLGVPGGQTFLQDNDGFLWIGSDGGGMFRYDGYELKNYGAGPGQLSNGNVWRIIEDRENPDIFWIGTSGGLNRFDKATDTFTYYKHMPGNLQSLGHNTVQDIVQDSRDPHILWLGTAGGGLNRFDKKTGVFTRYQHDPDDPDSLSFSDVWRLIEDRETPDILWIGTYGGGLDRFDKVRGTFIHHVHDPDNTDSLNAQGNNVDALVQDKDDPNILWIGTPEDGMDRFDKRTRTFIHYSAEKTHGEVALIYDDGQGRLWLGGYVMNNGLTLFDKKSRTFTNYKHIPGDSDSLGNDLVVNVYEDRSGIFWITTYSGKVDKIDRHSQQFALYQHKADAPGSLSSSAVTTVYEDRQGTIWVGTQSGLNRFDPDSRTFTVYAHDPEASDSLDTDHILGISEDAAGEFWISLYVGPLTKFDRETGKVVARYKTEAESFTRMIQDPHDPDILWLGTHMAGFAKFDKRSETFTFYKPDPKAPHTGPGNDYLYEIVHDLREEAIWLGGYFGGGLNRFDKKTETFKHYIANPNVPDSISADAVAAIYQDSAGRLWVGTKGGGLDQFDRQRETFTHYTRKQGVPTEVNAILEDAHGRLWLGTNAGIVRFDPETGTVDRRYTRSDGLQGNIFLRGSMLKRRNGEMWFGGTKGVSRFDPERLTRNPYPPPVVLTALTRGGEPLFCGNGKVPARTGEIDLDWQKNFFEFEFAALSYTIPEKNQYRYMLEGFDRDWYSAGTRRFGRYANLPGGRYTLRVVASNNDGVWNTEGVSLKVRVRAPFWESPRFWPLSLAVMLGTALIAYRMRMRAVRRQKQILEDKIRNRTADLEAQKTRLRESEARFRGLAEATYEGIILHDHGRIIDVNQAVVNMFGYPPSDLLTMSPPELLTPGSRKSVAGHIAAESETPCEAEGIRADGSVFPLEIQARVRPYGGRKVRVTVLRDITVRKAAETALQESQRLNKRIMKMTPDIIYVYDIINGKVVYVNERVHEFLEYHPKEIGKMGTRLFDNILHPDDFSQYRQNIRQWHTARDGDILTDEYRMRGKDGEWHWFDLRRTVFQRTCEGAVRQIIGTARDITPQKHMAEELGRAKDAAESSDRAKSEFLARMSHEIRTPLNLIIGMTYLLGQTELGSAQRDHLDKIQKASQTLLALFTDLLDFSGTGSDEPESGSAEFSLEDILKELSDQLRAKATPKGLDVRFTIPDNVPALLIGDQPRLQQILISLADNAVKFTDTGEIAVGAEVVARGPDQVTLRFSVSDTGVGIPPEKQSGLFDAFTQADGSVTRRFGGTGLGLALCKRLAEIMGGEIGFSSEAGRGSTFTFTAIFGRVSEEKEAYLRLCPYIRPAEPRPSDRDPTGDLSAVLPLLRRLAILLQEDDMEAGEYLDALRDHLGKLGVREKFRRTAEYTRRYDFENALAALAGIARKLNISLTGEEDE